MFILTTISNKPNKWHFMNFMIKNNEEVSNLKCEYCGKEITLEESYEVKIEGKEHYFCCDHCANEFIGSVNNHACSC